MFNFGIDKKTLYIILAVFVVISLVSLGEAGIYSLLITVPGVIIAMTFHEFAHAFVAYKLGDNTPKYQGRLNLNPLSHIDPIGFMMLIVANFGWGRPVQIDSRNFEGKLSTSACEAIVSIAGPIMNILLAFVFALISRILTKYAIAFCVSTIGKIVLDLIMYTVIVNIGLGVFNLIPLPPLDGSKVLMHFLPYNGKVWMANNQCVFQLVMILLVVTRLASQIISPIISSIYSGIMHLVYMIL